MNATVRRCVMLVVIGLLAAAPNRSVRAGQDCVPSPLSATQLADAAATSIGVRDLLEEADRPVALIARVGNDLSPHGLHFSHVGIVLRDHPTGRWRVWHLLNECGTDRAGLHLHGLFDYFAGHLTRQDAKIVFLDAALEPKLIAAIQDGRAIRLFEPRYNVLARPGSRRTQNSTAYILELLASSADGSVTDDRARNWQRLGPDFDPDIIHVAWGKRVLAGLSRQNVDFTDHSVGTRLAGDYPVVTVRSIFRHVDERRWASHALVYVDARSARVPVAEDRPKRR